MPGSDYSHRDILDKLGIKPGHSVAFATEQDVLEPGLPERVLTRTGRAPAAEDEQVHVVLGRVDDSAMAVALLQRWRSRLHPSGGIWLLSAKRGLPGYVDQRALIAAGADAGLVDNKTCSVSEATSGMRFVIRRRDRPLR